MFSIIFPGQGSQITGMTKEFYDNFNYVKEYFLKADEILNKKLSKIILEGPKEELDQTENTQAAIFLASYSIFKVIEKETDFKLKKAKYFAFFTFSLLSLSKTLNIEKLAKNIEGCVFSVKSKLSFGPSRIIFERFLFSISSACLK